MNLFALTIWIAAIVPLAAHIYCLWTLRATPFTARRESAYMGVLLGLFLVALNLLQLLIHSYPGDHLQLNGFILIAAPVAALLTALAAIPLMRRSGDFEVQSIGIPAVILSLFSMASVVALGSLTIAG